MRHNWHAGNGYPGCIYVPCKTSNVATFLLLACLSKQHTKIFLEVLKSTLLSPSNDTRSCATHVGEPRHTAKTQLSCRTYMYVYVLNESAEVGNTVLRCESHKDHESDARSTRGSMPWPSVRKSLPRTLPRHGLNDIACVLLQKPKKSTECRTEEGILPRAMWVRNMDQLSPLTTGDW